MRDLTNWTWSELLSALQIDLLGRGVTIGGDAESDNLWSEARSRVHALSSRLLAAWPGFGGDDTAADVTQALLVKLQVPGLLTHLKRLSAPEGYIVVAVRNHILSMGRRLETEQRVSAELSLLASAERETAGPQDLGELRSKQLGELRKELGRLPALERQLLDMRFRQELGIAAIAARHGMSYSAVAVRLFRVLRKLRDGLSKYA